VNTQNLPLTLSFDDVLLVPQFSKINSRSEVDLSTKISDKLTLQNPLITAPMSTVTGVEMAIEISRLGGMGILPRFEAPETQAEKVARVKEGGGVVTAAIGCKEGYLERTEMVVNAGADALVLDVAHGQMQKFIEATKEIVQRFGQKVTIISGVVATYEGARALFEAGTDSVRVGVGPGSICTTRIMTGHGVPQITALIEAARAAREFGKTIITDGGMKNSGDIVKALAAGASAITSGNMFAGTSETPGDIVEINGNKYKEYRGSTSKKEKVTHIFKNGDNGNAKNSTYTDHIEGVAGLVAYKGPVEGVVTSLLAGIRSGLSYSGAKNISELWEKVEFIRITPAGMRESGAHDIIIRE
jgi:IMP dehydrogenase